MKLALVSPTDSSIAIGLPGVYGPSPWCYIGNIRGVTVANADGINVFVDSDGQLGTISPRAALRKTLNRWIKPAKRFWRLNRSPFITRPDTKKAEDTPQSGLIAEDVAEVNPDLVVHEDRRGALPSATKR